MHSHLLFRHFFRLMMFNCHTPSTQHSNHLQFMTFAKSLTVSLHPSIFFTLYPVLSSHLSFTNETMKLSLLTTLIYRSIFFSYVSPYHHRLSLLTPLYSPHTLTSTRSLRIKFSTWPHCLFFCPFLKARVPRGLVRAKSLRSNLSAVSSRVLVWYCGALAMNN